MRRMKDVWLKRGIAFLLTFLLALSMVASSQTTYMRAEESEGSEDLDEPAVPEEQPVVETEASTEEEPVGGPVVGQGYKLVVNKEKVSFGNIVAGATTNYEAVVLTNMSTRDVVLYWVESDPEQCITVDAPQDTYIPVGQQAIFYVKANSTVQYGNHRASMIIGDSSDVSLRYGTKIDFSFNIVEPIPHIDSITVSPANASIATNSVLKFTATVIGEYNPSTAVNWSVSGQNDAYTVIDADGTLHIPVNETAKSLRVTATSVQDPSFSESVNVSIIDTDHSVSVIADPQAGGNINGGGTVADGGSVTVLAAPNITYRFAGWYYNGSLVSSQPKYTQTNVTSDMTLVAKFVKDDHYITIKKNHSEAGDVTESQFVDDGGTVVLQAAAKKGWQFEGWSENGKIFNTDVTYKLTNVKTDHTITAVFSKTKYLVKLAVNPQDCGKVSGEGEYAKGFDIKIKAEAYDGYTFKNWTYNGNVISSDPEYTIKNINQDYCLTANYEKKGLKDYTITAGVCTNDGVISPSGKSKVQEGGSMLYTITPKSGYRILAVAVDNVQMGAINSYTFTNVHENHTIAVAFTPLERAAETAKDVPQSKKDDVHKSDTDTVTPVEAKDPDQQPIVSDITDDVEADESEDEEYDYDGQEGITQELNLTVEEATDTTSENFQDVMYAAIYSGTLQVAIFDEFDHNQASSAGGDFINSQALPNLETVVDSLLTAEDIEDIVTGNQVKINVNIFDNSKFVAEEDKSSIDSAITRGMKVSNYFELCLLKTKKGECTNISETTVGLKVCMEIPADYLSNGRTFYIVRSHVADDGGRQVVILNDEDNDPNTITFTTDKFSAYALAYQGGETTSLSQIVMIVLVIAVATLALIIALVFGRTIAGRRRVRR